jgi:peptide deformylase
VAVLPILYADHAALRAKTKRVSSFDASLRKLAQDMVETMHAAHGVGLAANQVGVLLQIAVIQIPNERAEGESSWEEPIYLVNPEVIKRSGEREVEEGCLSVPGYRAKVKRSQSVTVKARDLHGREFRIRNVTGLLAQAIEHETDHLNGILYIDHLESLDELYKITSQDEEEEEEGGEEMDVEPALEDAEQPASAAAWAHGPPAQPSQAS